MSVCLHERVPNLVKVRLCDFLLNTSTQSRSWLKSYKANRYSAWVWVGERASFCYNVPRLGPLVFLVAVWQQIVDIVRMLTISWIRPRNFDFSLMLELIIWKFNSIICIKGFNFDIPTPGLHDKASSSSLVILESISAFAWRRRKTSHTLLPLFSVRYVVKWEGFHKTVFSVRYELRISERLFIIYYKLQRTQMAALAIGKLTLYLF
jgi:hypothetical protein